MLPSTSKITESEAPCQKLSPVSSAEGISTGSPENMLNEARNTQSHISLLREPYFCNPVTQTPDGNKRTDCLAVNDDRPVQNTPDAANAVHQTYSTSLFSPIYGATDLSSSLRTPSSHYNTPHTNSVVELDAGANDSSSSNCLVFSDTTLNFSPDESSKITTSAPNLRSLQPPFSYTTCGDDALDNEKSSHPTPSTFLPISDSKSPKNNIVRGTILGFQNEDTIDKNGQQQPHPFSLPSHFDNCDSPTSGLLDIDEENDVTTSDTMPITVLTKKSDKVTSHFDKEAPQNLISYSGPSTQGGHSAARSDAHFPSSWEEKATKSLSCVERYSADSPSMNSISWQNKPRPSLLFSGLHENLSQNSFATENSCCSFPSALPFHYERQDSPTSNLANTRLVRSQSDSYIGNNSSLQYSQRLRRRNTFSINCHRNLYLLSAYSLSSSAPMPLNSSSEFSRKEIWNSVSLNPNTVQPSPKESASYISGMEFSGAIQYRQRPSTSYMKTTKLPVHHPNYPVNFSSSLPSNSQQKDKDHFQTGNKNEAEPFGKSVSYNWSHEINAAAMHGQRLTKPHERSSVPSRSLLIPDPAVRNTDAELSRQEATNTGPGCHFTVVSAENEKSAVTYVGTVIPFPLSNAS